MNDRSAIFCLLLLPAFAVGCSSSSSSPAAASTRPALDRGEPDGSTAARPPATPAEVQRWERQVANAERATELLVSGDLHAGLSLEEFVSHCTPYQIEFVDRYAFIEFYSVPNLTGLSLVAVDGKLASATAWGCVARHEYFNILSGEQKRAASTAYETRLDPRMR